MPARVFTGITEESLDATALTNAARDPRCGAVAVFVGAVRNHDGGERVDAIEYSSHPSSPQVLHSLADRLAERAGVHVVVAWHRVGRLEVGDDAMVVAVGAEHRAQAFTAVETLVEEVNAQLPIWKKQQLADGTHSWSGLS